jgi:serine kinase of HPr protein (carbohydrate metabolism regulator)
LALLHAAEQGLVPFARLVADDRCRVEAVHGRLLVGPAPALAGLIEVRGLGIRRVPHEPLANVAFVVDVGSKDADRLPNKAMLAVELEGVTLPRLAVAAAQDALPLVLAYLGTAAVPE